MKFPPFSKGGEGGFVAGHELTLPLLFLKNLGQDRHNLKEIAHNSIIAFIEDGGVLIRVHRLNDLRCFYTSKMLYGTGKTTSHIKLRTHCLSCLTYLHRMSCLASINGRPRRTYCRTKDMGARFQDLIVLRRAHGGIRKYRCGLHARSFP